MPIDDNVSNITKISDIRSRRHSNVDSFQSATENIEVMDYTKPEPIYENQQNENDYQNVYYSKWISTHVFELFAALNCFTDMLHYCNVHS